jgi:hypothetical protein
MVEKDLGHAREDSKREYYHKGSQLLKSKHINTFTNGCLSRQPSLVINIMGTDDISRLPRLVTGLTDLGWGGGQIAPPPPPSVHSSVSCFAIPAHPPGD